MPASQRNKFGKIVQSSSIEKCDVNTTSALFKETRATASELKTECASAEQQFADQETRLKKTGTK